MKSGELHGLDEVLGVTVGVVASLLTVALCHYLGVARLSLMLAFLIADSPFLKRVGFLELWRSHQWVFAANVFVDSSRSLSVTSSLVSVWACTSCPADGNT